MLSSKAKTPEIQALLFALGAGENAAEGFSEGAPGFSGSPVSGTVSRLTTDHRGNCGTFICLPL